MTVSGLYCFTIYLVAFVIGIFPLPLESICDAGWLSSLCQALLPLTAPPPNLVQHMSLPCPCYAIYYPMGFSQTPQLCYLCRHALQGSPYQSCLYMRIERYMDILRLGIYTLGAAILMLYCWISSGIYMACIWWYLW